MIKWTAKKLKESEYKIENAKITSVDLSMADHGCLTLSMAIIADGWGTVYGGYCLGHGYLGASQFDGSARGLVSIMMIMNTVGVERFNDLVGKYIRVATHGFDSPKIIGNLIEDKWFDIESFYNNDEK